jgi:hypothetical protein
MRQWTDSRLFLNVARSLFALALLVATSQCTAVPAFPPDLSARTPRELVDESTLVVVGVIAKITIVGPTRTTDNGIRYQAWRIDVKPEATLKGEQQEREFSYYLYNYASGFVQNGDFDWLEKGDHRIFFLRREGRLLRAMTDLHKATIRMGHPLPEIVGHDLDPMGQRIARLFLTPGRSESSSAFAASIPSTTPDALRVSGYSFTARLLTDLFESQNPEIRTEACLTLYEQAFGDESCVTAIEKNNVSPDLGARIQSVRHRREYIRQIATQALNNARNSPFLTAYTYSGDYADAQSVRELLEYLARSSDAVLRQSAEKQLMTLREGRRN